MQSARNCFIENSHLVRRGCHDESFKVKKKNWILVVVTMKSSQWDKVKLPYCEQEHECLTLRAQGQKSEDGKMYVYNVSKMSLFLRM